MAKRAIIIDPKDNVANLIGPGGKGDAVQAELKGKTNQYTLASDIPPNHKFAATPIKKGQEVIKYGHCIGRASQDINVGEHVHAHNVDSLRAQPR